MSNKLPLSTNLSASVVEIHGIFSDKYDFEIPFYQRAYAWDEKQVEDLVSDLLSAPEGEGIFLGNLVLAKLSSEGSSDGAEHRNAIVDGQQRITTITLLLAVLRDLVEDDELKKNISQLIIADGSKIRETKPRPRLKPWSRHSLFFKNKIQEADNLYDLFESSSDNQFQERVKKNSLRIYTLLENKTEKEITDLVRKISKSRVVVTQTDSEDEAFQIFQTLNSRGLPLTFVDIIKAEIIGKLSDDQQEELTNLWDLSMDNLGEEHEEAIFNYLTAWKRKTTSQRNDISAKDDFFKHWPIARENPADFIENTLKKASHWFSWLTRRSPPPDYIFKAGIEKQISTQLQAIEGTGNKYWIPAAFSFLNKNPSAININKFLIATERLTHADLITKGSSAETRWYDVIRCIEKDESLFKDQVLHPVLNLTPAEQTLFYQALNGDLYGTLGVRKTVVIVRRIDQLMDSQLKTTHDKLTVEHILPRNMKAGGSYSRHFSEEEHARWVNRLANLALISKGKNSEASNSEFEIKKAAYSGGKGKGVAATPLTVSALRENEWTPIVLERLQAERMLILENHWKLGERDKNASEAQRTLRKSRKDWSHDLLGIPEGAILQFKYISHGTIINDDLAEAVGRKNKVKYSGKEMSLRQATIQACGKDLGRVTKYWFYDDERLSILYDQAMRMKTK